MPKGSGRTSLWVHLRPRLTTVQGIVHPSDATTATNTLALRYHYLTVSGLDYKGQLTSAYGDAGLTGSIGVGTDAGDLLLPGFLTLSVSVTPGGEATNRTLLILQRIPDKVYKSRVSHLPIQQGQALPVAASAPPLLSNPSFVAFDNHGQIASQPTLLLNVTQPSLPLQPLWQTERPVALTALEGWLMKGEAGLKGTASLSLPTGIDELGVELSVSGTLTLDGRVTLIRLNNVMFSHYPSPSVGDSLQESLNIAIELLFAKQIKKDLKAEINSWVLAKVKEWSESRREVWAATANTILAKITGFTTEKLDEQLVELRELINKSASPQKWADMGRIDAYRARLRQFRTPDGYKSTLNFLHLYSFYGSFGTGVDANASIGIPEAIPNAVQEAIPLPLEVNLSDLSAGVSAGAAVGGQVQFIGYRYQTLGSATKSPLLITQDTYVTYRQVSATAEVVAKAGIKRSIELEKTYHLMTYHSIVIYWIYPSHYATYSTKSITPCSGSGIVYGCSAKLSRIVEVAAAPDAPGNQKYIGNLAKQLRVDLKVVKHFLQSASLLEAIDPEQEGLEGKWPQVILESSFAFDETVNLEATPKKIGAPSDYQLNDPFNAPTVKTFVAELPQKQVPWFDPSQTPSVAPGSGISIPKSLEALRLRFRIADVDERVKPLFSLGFSHLGEFQIDLSRVRGAGHEGLIDLYTYWYNNSQSNLSSNLVQAAERSVPPVALLHQ